VSDILTREEFIAQFDRANGRLAEKALLAHDAALRAELDRVRTALEEIKEKEGRVCEEFELCRHVACASSYAAWQIADAAFAQKGEK